HDHPVGTGEVEIGVYRDNFPDDGETTGVSVFAEINETSEYDCIMPVGIRINARTPKKQNAFNLITNVDALLNMMVGKMLNDDIEMNLCRRNSGPSWFKGLDGLHYYTALYTMTVRDNSG
ncbi:unnamed protein product, partial [marine sediment metagenome]